MDQGSVLVHNTKTDLRRCDVLQPEVVPGQLLLRLISQEPIYPT